MITDRRGAGGELAARVQAQAQRHDGTVQAIPG